MFNDWMLGRATCRLLAERLAQNPPKLAVECGSGFSTALLAIYADTVIALDHDREHAAPWPPVRICEIVDGWYQTVLPDNIDFVLIDGPPGKIGRHNTFPNLWPRLADEFEVWVDDFRRSKERAAVADWQSRFPITVEHVETVKGLAVIRRA